jgi:hypothetical protein
MTRAAFIEIDGKRHLWRDILELRRRQLKERQPAEVPALFPLHHDVRPAYDRRAADRYREPMVVDR